MTNYLPLQMRGQSHQLLTSSILYIVQSERKVLFITDYGSFRVYGCVYDYQCYLDANFVYARKYMIVNFRKIRTMENCTVQFFNGDTIYLGKSNFVKLRKKYNEYLGVYQKYSRNT